MPRNVPFAVGIVRSGHRPWGYPLAVAAVTAALVLDLAVPPLLARAALLPFLCAVVVVAWYGGRGPALAALVVGALEALVVLAQPIPAVPPTGFEDAVRLAVYIAMASLAAWLTLGLRTARDRVADEAFAATSSRAQLFAVLDSVASPVAALTPRGELLFANRAATTFYGSDDQEAVATLVRGLAAESAPKPGEDGTIRRVELPRRGECWVAVQATPIANDQGAVFGTVVAWRDVTDERHAEAAREAFMGVLGHELRTPITTIYGGGQILLSRGDHLPAPTRGEIARDIVHEATRLSRIADNLLVLSRVERGHLQIVSEPVLLEPLVRSVVDSEAQRWPETPFDVTADARTRVPVLAAAGYVEQVLRNLLSNAAKYSGPGVPVHVRISAAGRDVVVRVVDEGPGFETEDAERLFEPYYRSPETAGKAPGTGIGLYVCRRLIEAMGGRIWGRRSNAGGAEFAFAMPAIVEAVMYAHEEPAAAAS